MRVGANLPDDGSELLVGNSSDSLLYPQRSLVLPIALGCGAAEAAPSFPPLDINTTELPALLLTPDRVPRESTNTGHTRDAVRERRARNGCQRAELQLGQYCADRNQTRRHE